MRRRFKTTYGTFFPFRAVRVGGVSIAIDGKGYPVFKSGAFRGQRVHRVVAEEMNGKKLTRDIDVHHEDHNKLNWDIDNLHMLGKAQHAWWSAIQHWYVPRVIAAREREQWEEFVGGGLS